MRPRLIFLFSDTGGGHRASAEAVARAMELEYPGRFEIDMIDPFVQGSRPLIRWLVYRYSWVIKHLPKIYGLVFHGTDNRMMVRAAIRSFGRQVRPGINRGVGDGDTPPAGIVSFHPLTNHVTIQVLDKLGLDIPFVTVITDMTDVHRFWITRRADIVVVPSMEARRLCISKGLDPRRVHIAGLPVNPRFHGPLHGPQKAALRRRLGLANVPTLLLVSGGEGSGRLRAQAKGLDRAGLGLQLLVVCGRNQKVQARLEGDKWKGKVHVYGFVDNMPELMQAADAVVTKAGPGTITEALISGLPLFLTGFVPGQEEGNVKFVIEKGVGYYTPRVRQLVKAVRRSFVEDRPEFDRMQGHAEAVGRTDAAAEIAQLIAAAVEPAPMLAY
jgi:1,2-diacylglycerol 3-beta-galactosyltransferase